MNFIPPARYSVSPEPQFMGELSQAFLEEYYIERRKDRLYETTKLFSYVYCRWETITAESDVIKGIFRRSTVFIHNIDEYTKSGLVRLSLLCGDRFDTRRLCWNIRLQCWGVLRVNLKKKCLQHIKSSLIGKNVISWWIPSKYVL